jgi:uncharacterized Zn finger protein
LFLYQSEFITSKNFKPKFTIPYRISTGSTRIERVMGFMYNENTRMKTNAEKVNTTEPVFRSDLERYRRMGGRENCLPGQELSAAGACFRSGRNGRRQPDRLAKQLVAARRYEDAERWIKEGIQVTKEKWPGIASDLRGKLLEIRTVEKNWPAVAAIQVEGFVRHPSRKAFTDCKKASGRVKAWPKVREFLLRYLEKGELPWKLKGWPLPESGLYQPDEEQRKRFPLVDDLIDIAILEKKPDQVLTWCDQRHRGRFGWYGVDENTIATAIEAHAPDRAVTIWKNKAEQLIAQVKPSAYQAAAKYLQKAAKVMRREKMLAEWESYLKELRETHLRKRRLIEILDGLDEKPIVEKRR